MVSPGWARSIDRCSVASGKAAVPGLLSLPRGATTKVGGGSLAGALGTGSVAPVPGALAGGSAAGGVSSWAGGALAEPEGGSGTDPGGVPVGATGLTSVGLTGAGAALELLSLPPPQPGSHIAAAKAKTSEIIHLHCRASWYAWLRGALSRGRPVPGLAACMEVGLVCVSDGGAGSQRPRTAAGALGDRLRACLSTTVAGNSTCRCYCGSGV